MAGTFTAVFDACVLYPFALRDLLVELATTDLFRGRWSALIHDEWMNAVVRDHTHITLKKLSRTRELMDKSVPDCLVTGHETLIDAMDLPDNKDRHVLAAAIRAGAQVIVTKNLKHFPEDNLRLYGIEAQHPDDFVGCLLDLSPGTVCSSVKRCRGRLKDPSFTTDEYLLLLERQELAQTVCDLRAYADVL